MSSTIRIDRLLVTFSRQGLSDRAQDRERQPRWIEGSTASRWLARRLSERLDASSLGAPKAASWAWVLPIERDRTKIILGVAAYRDDRPETWDDWLIQVLPQRFALRPALRRRRLEALRSTLDALHEALSTDPDVSNVAWHRRRDLNRGREELGLASPFLDPVRLPPAAKSAGEERAPDASPATIVPAGEPKAAANPDDPVANDPRPRAAGRSAEVANAEVSASEGV